VELSPEVKSTNSYQYPVDDDAIVRDPNPILSRIGIKGKNMAS
jgi:hypothetical protein